MKAKTPRELECFDAGRAEGYADGLRDGYVVASHLVAHVTGLSSKEFVQLRPDMALTPSTRLLLAALADMVVRPAAH